MVKKIAEIAKGVPSFAMGDLNSIPTSKGIQHISNCGFMKDSKIASMTEPVGDGASFHGFRATESPKAMRIDYIFVSSNVEVVSHKNLQTSTDKLAGFAYSDHEPATMVFKLK